MRTRGSWLDRRRQENLCVIQKGLLQWHHLCPKLRAFGRNNSLLDQFNFLLDHLDSGESLMMPCKKCRMWSTYRQSGVWGVLASYYYLNISNWPGGETVLLFQKRSKGPFYASPKLPVEGWSEDLEKVGQQTGHFLVNQKGQAQNSMLSQSEPKSSKIRFPRGELSWKLHS